MKILLPLLHQQKIKCEINYEKNCRKRHNKATYVKIQNESNCDKTISV